MQLWEILKRLGAAWAGKPRPPAPPPEPPPVPAPGDGVGRLLAQHDDLRRRAGVRDLALSVPLCTAAQAHAAWMAANRDMDHRERRGSAGFAGREFADRVRAAGYPMADGAENIAAGQLTPEAATNAWYMSDKGHRENMLDPDFRDVGFGYATDARGSIYWCAVFGATGRRALTSADDDLVSGLDPEQVERWAGPPPGRNRTPPAIVASW